MAMASRGFDLSGIIQNAFHLFKGKFNHACLGPCDGFVLKMHYRWAFYFTIGSFMTVWYGWYFGKVIHCVSSFKGDQEARSDYQNICLSYPYILDETGDKRFLLFYRWIHWSFLLIAAIYYIPRKVSKAVENPKAKRIFEDLAALSPRYDQSEKEIIQRASYYMITNMRTHNSIYYKYLGLNILTLVIDIFILLFLDFLLHDRFISLVPASYPFRRDPEYFKDYVSQTFPPFASCYLTDEHKILDGRKEVIGCHLTYMELFEKLFIIYWFIIYALILATFIHIIYLLGMLVPKLQMRYITTPKPLNSTQNLRLLLANVSSNLKVGDIYILHRIKNHLGPSRFYELLLKLGELKQKPEKIIIDHSITETKPNLYPNLKENQIVRNRNPNDINGPQPFNPIISSPNVSKIQNPYLLNNLLNDPNNKDLINHYTKLLKTNKVEDRSILIE